MGTPLWTCSRTNIENMLDRCAILGCDSSSQDTSFGIEFTLHRFPKNAILRDLWVTQIKTRCNPEFEFVPRLLVCSKHFLPSCYDHNDQLEVGCRPRLNPNSVPSIFPSRQMKEGQWQDAIANSVVWLSEDYADDWPSQPDEEWADVADVQQLCRFCLMVKPNMKRLDWSKWPTAPISQLFQQVVGEALTVSEKLSEFWCGDCERSMESVRTEIQRWKRSNEFWHTFWYQQFQGGVALKQEALHDDDVAMVVVDMLELDEDGAGDSVEVVNVPVTTVDISTPPKTVRVKRSAKSKARKDTISKTVRVQVDPDVTKEHPCTLCDKIFDSKFLMNDHRAEEHADNASLVCDKCGRSFTSRNNLYKHRKFVHLSTEYVFHCTEPGCGKSYRRADSLYNHKMRHGEKKLICDRCSMTFHLKKDMITHWHYVHLKLTPTICERCGMGFRNNYIMRTTHPPSVCASNRPQITRNTPRRSRPNVTSLKRIPLQCRACNRICHSPATLENHYAKMHPDWDVAKELEKICKECYLQFDSAEQRADHYQTVHKRWQCPICKMSLKCQESLDRHMQRHPMNRERHFRCEVCDAQYFTLAQMKNHHRRSHTTDRPHECPVCHKRFAELPEMRTHQKQHTRNPEPCPECGQVFANAKLIREHIRLRHTNDFVWFSCEFCPEKFRSATLMNWHARSHHPNEFQLGQSLVQVVSQ